MARQSEMMRLRLSLLVPNRIEQEVDKNILGHLALRVQCAHLCIHTFHFLLVTIKILNFTRMCFAKVILCWCKVYAAALSYKSSAEHCNV